MPSVSRISGGRCSRSRSCSGGRRRSFRGGEHGDEHEEIGGRRRRSRRSRRSSRRKSKRRSSRRRSSRRRSSRRRSKSKRKLNAYFKKMLEAKRKGAPSFEYKGNTYVGKKHHRLGMIYKRK